MYYLKNKSYPLSNFWSTLYMDSYWGWGRGLNSFFYNFFNNNSNNNIIVIYVCVYIYIYIYIYIYFFFFFFFFLLLSSLFAATLLGIPFYSFYSYMNLGSLVTSYGMSATKGWTSQNTPHISHWTSLVHMITCNDNKLVCPQCRPHLHFADCLAWGNDSYVIIKAFWDMLLHILFLMILLRSEFCIQVQRIHFV